MATKDQFWAPLAGPANISAAYCLGILAELSYTGWEPYLETWAQQFGMPIAEKFTTPGTLIPNVMIVGHSDQLIVAIPGTENFGQMMNNIWFSAQRENADFGPGRIHSFFLWCAEGIVAAIAGRLATFPDLAEVTFVGHSLGGAVAQLLADYLSLHTSIAVKLCVTYNAPRVGDTLWARRARPYPTHQYYNSHDMVTEFPTSLSPSGSAYQTDLGFVDAYEHRPELIRVESLNNIDYSWMAIAAEKAYAPVGAWRTFIGPIVSAAQFLDRFRQLAHATGIGSWVLPLPTWIQEHRMRAMLTNLAARRPFPGFAELAQMRNIHDFLIALAAPSVPPETIRFSLVAPRNFGPGMYPGGGGLADLPAVVPGTRSEVIEAAFDWIRTPASSTLPELIDVDEAFFSALAGVAANNTALSPLRAPAPILAEMPPRPYWLMRGTDRRLCLKLRQILDGIDRLDALRVSTDQSAAISTREQIFDWEDPDLWDAISLIRGNLDYALSLYRDPDPLPV